MNLHDLKQALNRVGWFIPPYLQLGFLQTLKDNIDSGRICSQKDLEVHLAGAYSPINLAAMVCERYPVTPFIQDYKDIIAEGVEAHFSGLGHVAVSGLLPVIEGAAKKLSQNRALSTAGVGIKRVFANLAEDCKAEAVQENIGAVDEILTMMDSFVEFTSKFLYENSGSYPLDDNTGRHGILHGAYSDDDYGKPINFYKVIGSIDFLCMVSAFRARVSWFAPDPTEASNRLCAYYMTSAALSVLRPNYCTEL